MHEIICPHYGKAFKIDEAGYADILKQVRDSEFEKQLSTTYQREASNQPQTSDGQALDLSGIPSGSRVPWIDLPREGGLRCIKAQKTSAASVLL